MLPTVLFYVYSMVNYIPFEVLNFFVFDNYTCIELPLTDNSKVLKCMNLTCLIKAKLANKTPV